MRDHGAETKRLSQRDAKLEIFVGHEKSVLIDNRSFYFRSYEDNFLATGRFRGTFRKHPEYWNVHLVRLCVFRTHQSNNSELDVRRVIDHLRILSAYWHVASWASQSFSARLVYIQWWTCIALIRRGTKTTKLRAFGKEKLVPNLFAFSS